jgi:acetate kinase
VKILTLNCGSSTLKFQFVEVEREETPIGRERRLAYGIVDRIGSKGRIRFTVPHKEDYSQPIVIADHGEATHRVLDWLRDKGLLGHDSLQAVGHRVVHGGSLFIDPTIINDAVITGIEAIRHLAPLHNEPSLIAIRAARAILGSAMPQVAVFDTAFHRTLPERAARYAIPTALAEKHHIRRYGFHGLAHRYMTERYAAITATPVEQIKLVTLQLGNGCSATAIENGRSVDTSMGFTPLEGLVMGTRSGDIDPSLAGFLARQENVDMQEVEGWLNSRSGLLGVSGHSSDMRELLEAEAQGNAHADLAVEMFCYRVRKYIGAYLVALGGADAIVFGGGIGENSPQVRARICRDMESCGLTIDQSRNAKAVGTEEIISADSSRIHAYVIPVDEEAVIARDTVSCLHSR